MPHTDCPDVTVQTQPFGFEKILVDNRFADCEIYTHGAHITSFRVKGQQELIWLSPNALFLPDKAIRGGIPICWPWFGAHPADSDKPAHGFARLSTWQFKSAQVQEDGSTEIVLTLSESQQSLALWPYKFALEYRIVVGEVLSLSLTVTNTGESAFEVSGALHTYFNVGDIADVRLQGFDGVDYFDKVDGNVQKQQSGDIVIGQEVDRVYLNPEDNCQLLDKRLNRTIAIGKSGSNSTIVWNPWQEKSQSMKDMSDEGYRQMLCVEAGLSPGVMVAPGQRHCLGQCLKECLKAN